MAERRISCEFLQISRPDFHEVNAAVPPFQEILMFNHKLRPSSDWRCRREEYLRTSGRREDLIREGYEPPGPAAQFVVIPGGGKRFREESPGIGLFVVKRGVS